MKIILTVTNDLSYDQRMQRIGRSLVRAGHEVELVGRLLPHSIALTDREFRQTRLRCLFNKGFLFYAEYNLRLFLYLLLKKHYDAIGTVDLDTLAAGFFAALLRGKKKVFDAHEYFTEVPELVNRPLVKSIWGVLARLLLPFYKHAYTVGPALAGIFRKKYGINFEVVRNMPEKEATPPMPENRERWLIYQGALNEGRGIAEMLQAMRLLDDARLVLYGEGDLSASLRALSGDLHLENQVRFAGYAAPELLRTATREAWAGLNLLENKGQSYYYSLANKFFDYVQAGVPVISMDFPEYRALNSEFEVAILLPDLKPETIAAAIKRLAEQPETYTRLRDNCLRAREVWNWEREEKKLLAVWDGV